MSTQTTSTVPGYQAGTWDIDPVHSDVSFTVRHMMVSKVRGSFRTFRGQIVTADFPDNSSVNVEIDMASLDTANEQRDNHVRSGDFFEVETYPTMSYTSTAVRADGDDWVVEGELTLKGVTKQVPLKVEVGGIGPDAYGGTRAGFSVRAEINRKDFGVNFGAVMESGGAVVSDKVQIVMEIEAVLQAAA